ncbi:Short-chain dehydrogenase/reductase ATR9 [Lachnellula suecica]|uniref:Short-chain dehydrogenase/reductase ATR9 n=1 Tax=Lachnellula suecica TaxID=602035 RepID=A0A8T9CFH6_9HELO|nr:Short-chain dehydrogenase/reductase ATR9 [Lachnellula suecica]
MPSQKYNKLAGKHILIIGGTSGIGYAVAEASIESNARVTISSSSAARVESSIASIKKAYSSADVKGYTCDLSKSTVESDLEALFKQTGNVDHIVFTAGDAPAIMALKDVSYDSIIAAGQIRFTAALLAAKVGAKHLNKGPDSSIVFTSGTIAERPTPNWTTIASYAAALLGMTRNLAIDLAPIRVNLVMPGSTDTELWNGLPDEHKQAIFKSIAGKVPTGHVGKPEEVAEAYLWLMKDSNVTGFVARSDSGANIV